MTLSAKDDPQLPPHAVCRCDRSAERRYEIVTMRAMDAYEERRTVCYHCMLEATALPPRGIQAGTEDKRRKPLKNYSARIRELVEGRPTTLDGAPKEEGR